MISFWTKLQIPGVILSQSKQPKKIWDRYAILNNLPSVGQRSFWSWNRVQKHEPEAFYHPAASWRPPPEKPKLYNPKCDSKCLQVKYCDPETLMKKFSNYQEIKKAEKPKSYWEMVFGSQSEKVEAESPVGKREGRQKQIERQMDPRPTDPRNKSTADDLLVCTGTTELPPIQQKGHQPQPPPPYKIPKAVLTKKMGEQAAETPYTCTVKPQLVDCAKIQGPAKCSTPKPRILPYEEMRPPQKRKRQPFSCIDGVRAKDVAGPMRKDTNQCVSSRSSNCFGSDDDNNSSNNDNNRGHLPTSPGNVKSSVRDTQEALQNIRTHSRTEQLKRQTQAKQTELPSEVFKSTLKINVSHCRSCCSSC